MPNEANYQNFYCYDPLSEQQSRSGTCGIHLAKQNKKALQPGSTTELQHDKHTVTQTQTAASSFEATVTIYFSSIYVKEQKSFPQL